LSRRSYKYLRLIALGGLNKFTLARTDAESEDRLSGAGGGHGGGGGEKSRGERALKKKMLINDERSLNVYENKRKDDKLSDK
jgi:hypothetical protein